MIRRVVLAAFPFRFRARYSEELEAVAEDYGGGWRVTADLARAAGREWCFPTFHGPIGERRRQRLQATTSAVLVAWALSLLAGAVFARAVNDKPVPGLRSWGWTAFAIGRGVMQVTAVAVVLAGLVYWIRVFVPALRRRDLPTLRAALLPGAAGVAWLAATGLIVLISHHLQPGDHRHVTTTATAGATTSAGAGGFAALVAYGVFTLVCLLVWAGGAARALELSALPTRWLARSAVIAMNVSVTIAVVAATAIVSLVRVLIVGGVDVRNTVMAIAPVALLLLAGVGAITSSLRGVKALDDDWMSIPDVTSGPDLP